MFLAVFIVMIDDSVKICGGLRPAIIQPNRHTYMWLRVADVLANVAIVDSNKKIGWLMIAR